MNGITDRADINQLLTQMQSMREQVQGSAPEVDQLRESMPQPGQNREVGEPGRTDFTEMLHEAVNTVNDTQQKASELQQAFEAGDPNVDITQVMIQMQKASVSFEAMNQVRNRLVSAYQDIMNMPI